jgi:hypothetical protein
VDLLRPDELPAGFLYPPPFLRMVERGLVYFEPWFVLEGEQLRARAQGLRARFPDRTLIPFARREDSDDVACWEPPDQTRVMLVHDFASAGWERRAVFDSFYDWLRRAVEDMIEFDAGQ